jgi:hypothetical protein
MKKRFIICHAPGIPAQDEAFRNWLNSQNLGWWHWMQGSWLAVDPTGGLTVEQIRDQLGQIYGSLCMVFEHDSPAYAGLGPSDDEKRRLMGDWIVNNWLP